MIGTITKIVSVNHVSTGPGDVLSANTVDERLGAYLSRMEYFSVDERNDEISRKIGEGPKLMKPGDIVVILRSTNGNSGENARILVIFRFWIDPGDGDVQLCFLKDASIIDSMSREYHKPSDSELFSDFSHHHCVRKCVPVVAIRKIESNCDPPWSRTPQVAR